MKKQRTANSTEEVFLHLLRKEKESYHHLDKLILDLESNIVNKNLPLRDDISGNIEESEKVHNSPEYPYSPDRKKTSATVFLGELERSKKEALVFMNFLQEAKNNLS